MSRLLRAITHLTVKVAPYLSNLAKAPDHRANQAFLMTTFCPVFYLNTEKKRVKSNLNTISSLEKMSSLLLINQNHPSRPHYWTKSSFSCKLRRPIFSKGGFVRQRITQFSLRELLFLGCACAYTLLMMEDCTGIEQTKPRPVQPLRTVPELKPVLPAPPKNLPDVSPPLIDKAHPYVLV